MLNPLSFKHGRILGTAVRLLVLVSMVVSAFAQVKPAQAAVVGANPPPIQTFFLSMPEDQVFASFKLISSKAPVAPMRSVTGISVTTSNTQIYYDQWENGYELDLANPSNIWASGNPGGTQIWGNSNAADGCPSNVDGQTPLACTNANDVLVMGNVIVLENNVPLPRTSAIFYDGRDKIGSTKVIAVTRSAWAATPGTVLADAVEVYDTTRWGTSYEMPVGEDTTNFPGAGVNSMYNYSALLVVASQNSTSVTIDTDGPGVIIPFTISLNQGDAYQVNGSMKMGATVSSTKPIQVNLLTGKRGSSYASRWYSLAPQSQWTSSLWTSVGTTVAGYPSTVFVFNPETISLTVNYETRLGSGSFSVPANSTYRFEMPLLSGAHFYTGGTLFQAVGAMDASLSGANQTYDWGYTLVPDTWLTTSFIAGWAPGTELLTGNGSPVWVTATKATTVYVDYGAPSPVVVSPTDPNGKPYNVSYALGAFESKQIYGIGNTQTGMKVWTADGTSITGAWGEDPKTAAAGTPYLDAGYTIPPLPEVLLTKAAAEIAGGLLPVNGTIDPGDTIEYTLTVINYGAVTAFNTLVTDTVPAHTSYVAGSTELEGVQVDTSATFPLIAGVNIPSIPVGGSAIVTYHMTADGPSPAYTEIVNTAHAEINGETFTIVLRTPITSSATSCVLALMNSDYSSPATTYLQNESFYVQVTDGDKNINPAVAETITAQVIDSITTDRENLILTETGVNTGVFHGSLPSSTTMGQAQYDGTLYALVGDSPVASYDDPVYGDTCNATATIPAPSETKQLYLSDPSQALNRVDPVATIDGTTALSAELGSSGSGTEVLNDNFTTNYGYFQEVGDDGVSTSGLVRHVTNLLCASAGDCVRFGKDTGGNTTMLNIGITLISSINLTGATSASVSFGYNSTLASNIVLQASTNNSTWTTVGTGVAAGSGTATLDISAYISGTTWIRIVGTGTIGGGERLAYIDNVIVTKNTSSGTTTATFTQAPTMAGSFAIPASSPVSSIAFVNIVTGSMPANPTISAIIKNGATTISTLNSPTYTSLTSSTGYLSWNGTTVGSLTTITAGQAISLDITTTQAGVSFNIQYDSSTKPSLISLPTTTVVKVDSLDIYDSPYPAVTQPLLLISGQTVYIRSAVSDPFGYADITSASLDITNPLSSHAITPLSDANAVSSSGAMKIYEYAWLIPAVQGDYDIKLTAREGYENLLTNVRSKLVTVKFADTGTPSKTEFTTGSDGLSTTSYESSADPTDQICLRVTDLDQNLNPTGRETIPVTLASTTGDTVDVTLTETGDNTGIFAKCVTREISSSNPLEIFALAGDLLSANYTDPNDPTDTSTAGAVMTAPSPTLSLSKQLQEPANGIAVVGEQVRFDFTVANPNPGPMSSVTVTDTFSNTCLSFSSASVTPDSQTATSLTWTNLGPLASLASRTISVYFNVVGDCGSTNTVESSAVYSGLPVPPTDTETASANVITTRPEVSVTKTRTSSSPAALGTEVTFLIVVTNTGSTQITTLPITDNYSAYCMEYTADDSGGSGSGGTASWTNLGPLNVGDHKDINVTFTVQGPCNPAQNLAVINSAVDFNLDSVPAVEASATVVTQSTAPVMTKTFNPAVVALNGVSTLTFNITNPNSSGALTGIAFSDTYPAGLVNDTPLSTSDNCGGTLVALAGGDSISFSGGTISGGGSCAVSVVVNATAYGTFNNVSSAVTAVNSPDGLTASKTLTAYSIDAVNDDFNASPVNGIAGESTATVFSNDTLDGGSFLPGDVTPSITNAGGIYVTINSDGTLNIPAATASGTYSVTYQICVPTTTICDTATVSITVVTPSIQVVKSVSVDGGSTWLDANTTPGPYMASGTDPQFRFVVTNTGDATLSSISLSDTDMTLFYQSNLSTACTIPSSLAADGSFTCYGTLAWAAGQHTDTATVEGTFNDSVFSDTDDANYYGSNGLIGISKSSSSAAVPGLVGTWDVTFAFHVENYGNSALTGLRVTDDLAGTFLTGTTSTTFSVRSLTSPEFSVNPLTGPGAYSGFGTGIDMLTGDDTLAVGGSGTILLVVRVVPDRGSYFDTAFAYGNPPSGSPVSDESTDGTDPDSTTPCTGPCSLNGDGNPTNNTKATEITFAARLFDPPFGQKTVNAAGLPELIWTMVWINGSNIVEVNAAVSDEIPLGTTYVAGSVVCSPASGLTITDTCLFEAASLTYPRGRILWTGQIGPDLGATDATSAANELVITFRVTVSAGINSVQNEAVIDSDLNGNGLTTDPGEQRVAVADAFWPTSTPTLLPSTGFAPNRVTSLPAQTTSYEALGDLWLEIPRLGVKMPIVGVPQGSGSWDVSWLGSNAGWLNGTAFPTHAGNSVLTGHVFDAFGTAGPFVHLNWLWYGDKVIVHAWGADYTYEVRQVKQMSPGAVSSVLKHEVLPWVTLVTCRGYDEASDTYLYRVVVRAVLVDEK
jgi:LPXTG-site transpeptidase (sortase) family protein